MIDLHSHLLPAVDDGSRSVEQSVGVLRAMAAQGVTDLCLTPHFVASRIAAGVPAAHDAAFAALAAAAPPSPRLHRGAEIMLDRPLPDAILRIPGVRLGGTRYVLVEFPRLVTGRAVAHALAYVVELGLIPLLAHPERYSSCTVAAVSRWRDLGARMQVDATTLLSARSRGDRARALVGEGLADVLAADNHGDDRTPLSARRLLEEHGGGEQARLLLIDNPRAVLDDRTMQPVEPLAIRTTLIQKLRRFLGGHDE